MDIHDVRRLALSLEGAEEGAHMGNPDFRVGGHIFATLASASLRPGRPAAYDRWLSRLFATIRHASDCSVHNPSR